MSVSPRRPSLLTGLLHALRRLHERQESGAAMVEFAVVFPAQLLVTMAIMQFSLLMVGHVIVQHAAFAAARAALVQDVPPPGSVGNGGMGGAAGAQAQQAAEDAAAIVLATVSPADDDPWNGLGAPPRGDITWAARGGNGGVLTFKTSKGAYGLTQVSVDATNADYVAATVQHDFVLQIPVVNRWFASGFGAWTLGGGTAPDSAVRGNHGFAVMPITKTGFVPRPWRAP